MRGANISEESSESSGMYCHVLFWMLTDVSEVRAASIIRAMSHSSLCDVINTAEAVTFLYSK
jgi:hypothetical protein